MLVDSHCHLDDAKFDGLRESIIQNLNKNKIGFVINAGADFLSSQQSLSLSKKHKNVYCVIGQHPQGSENFNKEFEQFLLNNAQGPKVVGIGEIGLDYYYLVTDKQTQKQVFLKQLKMAHSLNLPVVLHIRDAWGDALQILRNNKNLLTNGGVVHCFSGSEEVAKELLNMGFYLGFDGPVTYKNAGSILDVVKSTPLNRILIETDSPYLAPQPLRGQLNTPQNVKFVAEKICEIKNISMREFEEQILINIKTLYKKIN